MTDSIRRIWLFNPENDLALAADKAAYTAPPAAVRLRDAGAVLPMWLGSPGDFFICDGVNDAWLTDMQARFGLEVNPWDRVTPGIPVPWGWSKAARATFERRGIPAAALPPDSVLDAWRSLSHRATSVKVYEALAGKLSFGIWAGPVEVRSVSELKKLLAEQPYSVVKLPWSSSGRGVTFADAANVKSVIRQAEGAIGRYGSVMVEKRARRLDDFAMLFTVGGGAARFQGLSLFKTDDRGRYAGNFVGPQQTAAAWLGSLYPLDRLMAVAEALTDVLPQVLGPSYAGPVGVDMLLGADDGGAAVLNPVVELNLRYTMGFVALALGRFTAGEATFRIERGDVTATCRPEIRDGRLVSGTLALTPPGGAFTFVLSAGD